MAEKDHSLSREEISRGFAVLGLPQERPAEYVGAQNFGASFKRCSILKDVNTVYSRSTTVQK